MSDDATENGAGVANYQMTLWRNYDENAVGLAMPGQPPQLLSPEDAREMADAMERDISEDVLDADGADHRNFIRDLRQYADDVEVSDE